MNIGDRVKVRRQVPGKPKGTYEFKKGKIVATYEHIIVVDFGRYKEAFNDADIATGEVQVI